MTKYGLAKSHGGRLAFGLGRGLAALLIALSWGGCGSNLAHVGVGLLSVTPDALTFNAQAIGVEDTQYLTLRNTGGGELIVTDLGLSTRSDEFQIVDAELPIHLQPNEERVVQVTYTPADCNEDRGNLVIQSNDTNYPDGYDVPLQPQGMTGQVFVNPSPIDFGRVPAGDEKTLTVTVTNSGTCALHINDLFITGSDDFTITQSDGNGSWTPVPDFAGADLDPAASYQFDVTYHPANDGFDQGTLLVRSDDARNRTVQVPIVANGDQPCIVVTDEDGIDFGQRFIGDTVPKTVTITNCSEREDLLVSSIALQAHFEDGGYERFSLADLPDLSTPLTLAPQATSSFILDYAPIQYTPDTNPACTQDGCIVTDGALLVIESNDAVKSPLQIEVTGVGTNNHCPIAVARARVQGSGGPFDTQVDAIPQDVIEFDGSASSDPEGSVQAYQWETTDSPVDNVSIFQPNATIANPTYEVNVAGQYTFTLRVFDDAGVESCDPASILVVVTPNEAIHVELSWETPADPDRTDTGAGRGSDVDLHFLHPNAGLTWNRAPWDCHWQNRNPNWGGTGRDDDPSLDRDDTDGWGPENINLNQPEGTTTNPFQYAIGVFYFSDHGYGASDTTVHIYLDGVERFARTLPGLTNRQFWDVARVYWPTREIESIHRLYPANNLPPYF